MGYSTTFSGRFDLDKKLAPEHCEYLRAFSSTRRMSRDSAIAETLPDPVRLAAGLPIGPDGGYYVGGGENYQHNQSIVDINTPPADQPGLWCQWVPTEDARGIEWDEGEKFYDYVEWLEYLIAHFLARWGYKLNGRVIWRGEEPSDQGVIEVANNTVNARSIKRDIERLLSA